jgi:DNA-binding transcriptional LysR family regulator
MQHMNYPDLNLLYALDALLSTGSVKEAANRMNLSPPAMSHTLARLRAATGDELLVRAGRRLVPTPRALEMLIESKRISETGRQLLSETGGQQKLSDIVRTFTLMVPDGLSVVLGARLLNALQTCMPHATLCLLPDSVDGTEQLRSGLIDLVIQAGSKTAPELLSEEIYSQGLVVAFRKESTLARGKLTLDKYCKAKHVCVATNGEPIKLLNHLVKSKSRTREIHLRVPTPYAALFAASRSDLIATVAAGLARGVAEGLGLVCCDLPLEFEPSPVLQLWHPRMNADAGHQWLRQCLKMSMLGKDRLPVSK